MRLRGCWTSFIVKVPLDSGVYPSVPVFHTGSFSKCFLGFRMKVVDKMSGTQG